MCAERAHLNAILAHAGSTLRERFEAIVIIVPELHAMCGVGQLREGWVPPGATQPVGCLPVLTAS